MDIEYKIIGGDDVEYGPASLVELKTWIRDGRVAAMTKVWRSDLSAWSPADRYTELLEDLARLNAVAAAAVDRALPRAGFWSRLAAYIVDLLVLSFLFVLVWTPIATAQHWTMPELPQTWTQATFHDFNQQIHLWRAHALPIFYPIWLIYTVLLTGRFGATFGKMAIGAKITMIDGSPIGYNRAFLRWVASRVSDIGFVGYIMIGVRRDKRGLHDLMAGTKVVFKR